MRISMVVGGWVHHLDAYGDLHRPVVDEIYVSESGYGVFSSNASEDEMDAAAETALIIM